MDRANFYLSPNYLYKTLHQHFQFFQTGPLSTSVSPIFFFSPPLQAQLFANNRIETLKSISFRGLARFPWVLRTPHAYPLNPRLSSVSESWGCPLTDHRPAKLDFPRPESSTFQLHGSSIFLVFLSSLSLSLSTFSKQN